jgi:hypothetical protein
MIERAGSDDFCCAAKCGHGGIGRHAGLRIQWETMQVRILLSAPLTPVTLLLQGVF